MLKKLIIVSAIASVFVSVNAEALVSTKHTASCQTLGNQSSKYPEKKIKGFSSESLWKKMQTANQLMADGQKSQAKQILMEIRNDSKDSYALSVVNQYLARMAYDAGDFNGAVRYATDVINLDALPVEAILNMKKQLAYAYASKKDLNNGIKWLNQYMKQKIKPLTSDYKTLASFYGQNKQYKKAICPTYMALKGVKTSKDKESLYKNLFGFHYQLKDLNGSAKILSEMINFFPNEKKYWEQLFSIEYQRGNKLDALAVSELAYKKGFWTKEAEVKNLAALHGSTGSPYNAAVRFEEGLSKGIIANNQENLKILARFWDQAKADDKAISAYNRLTKVASTGKYFFRIGNIHFSRENYKEAISAFNSAIQKGNMKASDAGNSYLQMGAAKFYLGQEAAAIQALEKAKQYDVTKRSATSWQAFIREKQRVREAIKREAEELEAEVAAQAEAQASNND